ncbi:hypothetical protein KFZ76_20080 [Methylovulum psychrotolerans]|uniref:hypothetical protein n=1 Tax=Methylovulum psychrotolerans TaxID=1704499 RepID=UPI001BFF68CA|nr:hypothetical protein [Methylovulum psychrotolerans]MBT9100003.1 hypothetical protein [Methylovulum psychrotolerans]
MSKNTAPTFLIKNSPVITDLGYNDTAYSVKVQADGKVVVVGISLDDLNSDFGQTSGHIGVARYNSNGTIDTSFSGDGWLTTAGNLYAYSSAVQSDGKILAVGTSGYFDTTQFVNHYDFTLIRYNTDGSLDSSFGTDGTVTTSFVGSANLAYSVALQSDGKILAAGQASNDPADSGLGSHDFGLVRYNSDGSLDTTFGNGGKVTTDMGSTDDVAKSVLVQSNGKIVLAGHGGLARYNSNGSLDTTFSGDGKVATDYSINSSALLTSGKIVAGGGYEIDRYNANGSLDNSFSGDGKVATDFTVNSIALQANGKLVAVGDNTLARYNSDGSLDTTFSGDGKVQTSFTIESVTVQTDGKLVVTGTGLAFGNTLYYDHDFYTARYNANGSLDTTFNTNLNTVGFPVTVSEGGLEPVDISLHALISDAQLDALNGGLGNYSGASLTLARHGGANAEDVFGADHYGDLVLQNGTVTLNGTAVGTYQQSPGQLSILFGTATSAQVNSVLHQLTYTNSSETAPSSVQLDWTFNDGDPTNPLSTTATTPVTITAHDSAPIGFVSINGTAAVGQTLTATNTISDLDGMVANTVFTYQWQGSSDNGTHWTALGSGANLVLTQAMLSQQIQVTATYTDAQGFTDSTNAVQGTAGNDVLGYHTRGNLIGLDGNDQFYSANYVNELFNGGNGEDLVNLSFSSAGATVNLGLSTAQDKGAGFTNTFLSIEDLIGSNYGDTLTGSAAANALFGMNGNDTLNGGDGNDTLNGGADNDTLDGGAGIDMALYSSATLGVSVNLALTTAQNTLGAGTDTLLNIENLTGSAYNDVLLGSTANNTLLGGAGNDLLAGGLGNDTLTGGAGQDTFAFNSTLGAANIDTITDFSVADDTIRLSKGIFTTLTSGVLAAEAFKIIGNGGVADSTDHLLYNTATGSLSYDADGSGAGAAVQIAILGTGLAMTNADFMVV